MLLEQWQLLYKYNLLKGQEVRLMILEKIVFLITLKIVSFKIRSAKNWL